MTTKKTLSELINLDNETFDKEIALIAAQQKQEDIQMLKKLAVVQRAMMVKLNKEIIKIRNLI